MKEQLLNIIFVSNKLSTSPINRSVDYFESKTNKVGTILNSGPITGNN